MQPENSLGRYTVLRELGRGAIGAVYAARDRSTGATVALKVLDPALVGQPGSELAASFLKNARAATRLRHSNIVRVFAAEEGGGTAFVTMELVEAESLRRVLDERPLPIARAIRIFDDVASALAYAHEEGVVHRGVRPSSIFVLGSGAAKIGDFGLGQVGEGAQRYLSPEQVRRDAVDHRSDLFSLGVVLYEMLARRAPFDARESILRSDPPPPSTINPHVPGALEAIVARLLARNPDERFASARDLLRDLQRLEEALGLQPLEREPVLRVPAPANEDFHEREERFLKDPEPRPEPPAAPRTSFLAALALILALLSIGLTAALYYSPGFLEPPVTASQVQEAPPKVAAAPAAQPPAPPPPPPVASEAKPEPPKPVAEEPAPEPQPAGTAKLILAVSPRGELYVDGKHHGTTPPLRTLELEPGMHRIEIRSGSRKPFLAYVTLEAGDERRIRHDFSAKSSRPPG